MAELLQGPIPPDRDWGQAPADCGALVQFQGIVRNHHQGRTVTGIHYHAYPPLAQRALDELEAACRQQFELPWCRIAHGTGWMEVGEISVVILTASPHRDAAYAANRWAIDQLKHTVPIWKQERFADGSEAFAAGQPIESITNPAP